MEASDVIRLADVVLERGLFAAGQHDFHMLGVFSQILPTDQDSLDNVLQFDTP